MKRRILYHSLFWIAVIGLLTLFFGKDSERLLDAFYFVSFLLPVAMGTTYLFNYYLVPIYLIRRRYAKFFLYLLYTIIASLYLEMMVITVSFIVFAQYQYDQMLPKSADIFTMAMSIYLVVFIVAFVKLVRSLHQLNLEKSALTDKLTSNQKQTMTITSDRKQVPLTLGDIRYIESLSDYVKIHHEEREIITKEKISRIEKMLPDNFVRIHRSFIINIDFVQSFTREEVQLNDKVIPISRTYKKEVLGILG